MMRHVVRGAAVAATLLLPTQIPPVPAPAPIHVTATVLAAVTTAAYRPEIIDYPGRIQGFAPPRWAWLERITYG